jgi:hypothetical protein
MTTYRWPNPTGNRCSQSTSGFQTPLRRGNFGLDCEPQQAGGSLAIFNWTRQMGRVLEVCGRGVVAMDAVNVVKPPKYSAEKESGSRDPVAARGFENGVWPSPGLHGRGEGADLRRDVVRSTICTLCPRAGHRTWNVGIGKPGDWPLSGALRASTDIRGGQRWRYC